VLRVTWLIRCRAKKSKPRDAGPGIRGLPFWLSGLATSGAAALWGGVPPLLGQHPFPNARWIVQAGHPEGDERHSRALATNDSALAAVQLLGKLLASQQTLKDACALGKDRARIGLVV
jgi:hypothetical protein